MDSLRKSGPPVDNSPTRLNRLAWLALAFDLALIGGSCTSASGSPQPSPTPAPCPLVADAGSTCILILGDSIAAGDGVAQQDRWPVRLEALLRADLPDRDVVVSNWAYGGSQIDLLERRVIDLPLEGFEVAIVITGVNDTAVRSVDEWAPRYTAAIERLEDAGLTVVIGTAPPTFEDGIFTDRIADVARSLRKIAGMRAMLDIAKRWNDLGVETAGAYYLDNIHPNEAGQAIIAELARPLLVDILETPTGQGSP